MKMAGRKTSAAYELYGFIPKVDNGKHSAICLSCNRVLQNTATIRLQKHRNSCLAARASGSADPAQIPNIEMKRKATSKSDATQQQQNENVNSNIKTEQSNIDFEDANISDNANDNITYEDTLEVSNSSKRARRTSTRDAVNNISNIVPNASECNNTTDQGENSMLSPIPSQQQQHQQQHHQHTEPFESYHANNTNTTSHDVDEDDIEEINDEDLLNIEEELDVIQNLMPRSKQSKQLHDELSKAETEYYRCKAAYFTKLTENCKIKRTLMLLESRKLQLEIERLTNEC
ncbi:insulator binding factor 1 isoform 1-T2 [Cochliomyia hominivorax]